MNLEQIFLEIIERKHRELNLEKNYSLKFSKIRDFEGNAIGQIGEEYIKLIVSSITEIEETGNMHDEFDIITKSKIYIEVKTARKGRTNDTFQFNGLNPEYNYNYLICLGICEDKLLYRLFLKSEMQKIDSIYYVIQDDFNGRLAQMNPGNNVNYKLTIKLRDLYEISFLIKELKKLL